MSIYIKCHISKLALLCPKINRQKWEVIILKHWKEQTKALFFIEKLNITEISNITGVNRKSISKYLKSIKGYTDEIERRKNENLDKRKEYKRNWDRKNRPNRYSVVNGETIRREHDIAAAILSREKYH